MKKLELSDEQIEKLLGQMPKIIDKRDKNEIYQSITLKMKKRKQKVWIMPSIATAAALLLFFILAPNLMPGQVFEEKSLESTKSELSTASEPFAKESADTNDEAKQDAKQEVTEAEDKAQIGIGNEETSKDKSGFRAMSIEDSATALYEEDINGMEVLTYAIPDENAEILVPVSVLVQKEENKSKFDLFEKYMVSLREEEWGLSDYYPLNADLIFDGENRVFTVNVPADHTYGQGSASEIPFTNILTQMMTTLNLEKINLTTEGNPGIEFGNLGPYSEFALEEQPGNHAYYFYYPSETMSKPFIIPFGEKLNSIKEAFSAMRKNAIDQKILASIPEDIQFETKENEDGKKLTIRFDEGSVINDDEPNVHTIEAILLTAKEFSYQAVKLENANIDRVGRFNLNEELLVPVAANKKTLP